MRITHYLSMKVSPFPFSVSAPFSIEFHFRKIHRFKPITIPSCKASIIPPPPPDFDFRNEILGLSTAVIAETHPELLDLARDGALVMINKSDYGPVPSWRSDFVEPDSIWLIGTTHTSQQSASDVERVIRAVRPDNVVVELCRSRAGIMYTTENGELNQQLKSSMFSLSGTGFFGAVGRSINLGGQTALALRLLLAAFSSKVSSDINRPFGDEFRAARKVAEEIGAQLVLGDRPIEITLERAWTSLKWNEKLNLVYSVIRGITSSDVSKTKMTEFLAWSLKRSKAVNKSKKVVGVIGKGHVNGVIYSLISDQGNLRFKDLAGKKPYGNGSYGWIINIAKDLFRDTVIAILLWLAYEQITSVF
ncbi:uncharacterized protein [Henckelia pumila]|uniref:uncharacterized protein isoform X2 n=1 Tax=Henckelia pumila TaxID=405737 RepID=UPI003C6E74A6